MVLLLKHDDVLASVNMADSIEAMEIGFKEQAGGGLIQPPRLNLRAGEPGMGFLRIGPCVMENAGWMGFKAMNLAQNVGVRYQVHLYSLATGELKAIMDAQHLTTLRTGATSAVATRRLGPKQPTRVGVLGAGGEARAQLEAMWALGLVDSARLYSPTPENRERLARIFRESCDMEIETVSSEREAVDGCGIIVSAVNSAEPVILGDWLKPGMHVNSVGTARPTQREIDADVYRRANIIAVDTREGVFHEAGDAIAASEAGAVSPDAAFELHEIVGGTAPVREDDNQITLFKSIGTAVQDVSLAARIYENARERGIGEEIEEFPAILQKYPDKIYI